MTEFLSERGPAPRGASLRIVGQRPSASARRAWASQLGTSETPALSDILAIGDPHGYLVETHTDRLVPERFLRKEGFLTRNLGGWSPVYFGVGQLPYPPPDDPLLSHLEVLASYGDRITHFGADPKQVARRLPEEMDGKEALVAPSAARLERLRELHANNVSTHITALHDALAGKSRIAADDEGAPVPELLLADALLDRLVTVELRRRDAEACGDQDVVEEIDSMQRSWAQDLGLRLILKGEYIAGRHRRSTIMIAEELGCVVKQPAPEPFHEIMMDAVTYDGATENWPSLTKDGALVMPQGRVRLILEDGVVPRLHQAFDHGVRFSSLLGLVVEDHVPGPTVQEWVQEDPERMTQSLYEGILATQQACEILGVNNPDWHSANFIVEENSLSRGSPTLTHIDWGAARVLSEDEKSKSDKRARRDQVQNLAFSFHDEQIAQRVREIHATLKEDPASRQRVANRADELLHNAD